jgi:hypothetical protein
LVASEVTVGLISVGIHAHPVSREALSTIPERYGPRSSTVIILWISGIGLGTPRIQQFDKKSDLEILGCL